MRDFYATADALMETYRFVKSLDFDGDMRDKIRQGLDELSLNYPSKGYLYHPVRIALSGQESSPPPQDLMSVLGKEESLKRIEKGLKKIGVDLNYSVSWDAPRAEVIGAL